MWTLRPAWAAAPYPSQAVRIIVPFTPGGTTDYVSRLVGGEVSRSIGQPVVVDNRPGAGTVIGVDAAAKAAPDGYTFVTVANSFAVNRTLVKSLPYDSMKDLRPVALMGLSEHVLAAYPGLGIKTITDLVAYGRKNPGKLSFASFGNGTSAHLAGEMLKSQLGLDMVHVPYKGQGPALNDLLGGQVSIMFGNWPEFRPQVQAGKLVAIGMATAKRSIYAKDIPTLAEQGAPIESNSWNGLLAPAATPDAQVMRINAEVNKALATPAVQDAFAKGGIEALPGTPDQFAAFLASEYAKYAKVIHDADIKLES
ncbi:MAG: LacI family transcriptional regulator [Rhizobacter sp.]|nr:LacI family transcriptional regulator [Rhizobacter sp.]